MDSNQGKVTLVVDGQLLGEGDYEDRQYMDKEEDLYRTKPANLRLVLGYNKLSDNEFDWNALTEKEYTGKVANLNVFASALSVERMVGLTMAGGDECGAPGDLVSWEEAEWTLHSQAKVIEVDREWEGPCRRESLTRSG